MEDCEITYCGALQNLRAKTSVAITAAVGFGLYVEGKAIGDEVFVAADDLQRTCIKLLCADGGPLDGPIHFDVSSTASAGPIFTPAMIDITKMRRS